jgi:hypothetical protein
LTEALLENVRNGDRDLIETSIITLSFLTDPT